MNNAKPYLSLIIPAYNEEQRIRKTLESVYSYLSRQPYPWEILIVLDGPEDNTLGQVESFAEGRSHIRWINRLQNRGKGYTVREGMLAARGEIRLFADADNSTDIKHFDQMRPLFEQGYDVVICSRDAKDAPGARQAIPQPFLKRLLGNAGNLLIQVLAVPGIWDTQCGFKAFTEEAAREIFSVATVDHWAFDIEALALARRFHRRIGVIGAHWIDQPDTHVNMSDYFITLLDTVKIRWNLMSGDYRRSRPAPVEKPVEQPHSSVK